ncbi:MAG: ABC transporter permease [Dehalococcoidia bacterium]
MTRVIHGGRITLIVATTVLLSGLILGTTLGLTAGYIGGQVDELIMRIVDFTLAFPFILVAVAVVVVFGASVPLIIILLVIFGWGGFARQARAMTLSLKTADYVAISRIAGASTPRILFRHILPGIMNTMMVLASLAVGGVILAEATLSFLGVGVPRPNPAWGLMVSSGRDYIRDAWWLVVMPGVAIFAVVFSINFLGDWLRDRFDPRLRQL